MIMNITKHTYQRAALSVGNLVSRLLPPTRAFVVRRMMYRQAGLKIGKNVCIVGGAKFHYRNISIGENTWVGTQTHFFTSRSASIIIGARVDIAPGCLIGTGTHHIGNSIRRAGRNTANSIQVGDGTWIGMGAMILDGTIIGEGCIIAAGAVVRGKFPDNVMIGGLPARIIKTLPD